ncbi:MAG TPA: hydroxyacid dehydrogenase [Bacteroidales bacterium]|nr:hydroxyacid dehydrogenase [Bacteroidales bacterium]
MSKKIVFAEPIGLNQAKAEGFKAEMLKHGYEVVYYDAVPVSQSDLQQRIQGAEVLVISNHPIAASTLQSCPTLKLISVAFTGVDHVPLDYCRKHSITVCNAAGYSTTAVAELTLALAIALLRNIVAMDAVTRNGGTRNGFLGGELAGKTFGIVGFGAIGQRVAQLALAYGCRVVAHTRTPKSYPNVSFVSLEELFSISDIVSLHLPATQQTVGLVNSKLISLMKPTALIVNTARGSIIDCMALSTALRQGQIAGAAIDVYEHEPPIEADHPLLKAPNTILLPHIAYATHEAIGKRASIVLDNIQNWIMQNPQNVIV